MNIRTSSHNVGQSLKCTHVNQARHSAAVFTKVDSPETCFLNFFTFRIAVEHIWDYHSADTKEMVRAVLTVDVQQPIPLELPKMAHTILFIIGQTTVPDV